MKYNQLRNVDKKRSKYYTKPKDKQNNLMKDYLRETSKPGSKFLNKKD